MECGKVGEHYKTPYFHLWPTLLEWPCQEQRGLAQPPPNQWQTFPPLFAWMGWDHFCGLWVRRRRSNHWSCCLPMSNPWLDLPMDCTAWWFWTMRQSNGCSTPAPRSSAAKPWIERTVSQMMMMKAKQFVLVYCRHSHQNQPCCSVFWFVE